MINDDAEHLFLSGVMFHGAEGYAEVAWLVGETEYLVDPNRQIIWGCIRKIFLDDPNAKLDYSSVIGAAKALGCDSVVSSVRPYLKELYLEGQKLQFESLKGIAAQVVKAKIIRDGKGAVAQSADNLENLTGTESANTIISSIESPIFEFVNKINNVDEESSLMGYNAVTHMEHLGTNPRSMIGISTGFPLYDMAIGGGLQAGDANFVAARMKKG
jgi:hypothetical protein